MTNYKLDQYGTLEWFRHEMGVPPWGFWGFSCDKCCGKSSCRSCGQSAWAEYGWQNGRVSRDDVRKAIAHARDLLEQKTLYPAGDKYLIETVDINNWPHNRCDFSSAKLCHPIKKLGVEVVTSVGTFDVVYLEGDRATGAFEDDPQTGLIECTRPAWFVVEFPTPAEGIREECNYQLHIPTPERFGEVSQDTMILWDHIVTDEATGVTQLWGKPWQCGRPTSRDAADCAPIDCTDENNFLEQLELVTVCHEEYGLTTDTACVILIENGHPCDCCNCCGTTSDGRISTAGLLSDGRHGRIEIPNTVYNEDSQKWECCSCICKPDQVQVKYLAGRVDCRVNSDLLAPLAAGLMPSVCEYACGRGCNLLEKYMQDFTIDSQGDTTLNVPFEFNNNPFGFTYGAGLAYQRLMKLPGYIRPVAIVA